MAAAPVSPPQTEALLRPQLQYQAQPQSQFQMPAGLVSNCNTQPPPMQRPVSPPRSAANLALGSPNMPPASHLQYYGSVPAPERKYPAAQMVTGTGVVSSVLVQQRIIASLVSEFLGTFVLVFTIACASLVSDKIWAPTAVSSMVLALTYTFFPVSGAMFNPMISVARGLTGRMRSGLLFPSIFVQLIGGLAAGAAVQALLSKTIDLAPVKPYNGFALGFTEMVFSAVLAFVYLNCAVSSKNNPPQDGNQFFGLAISGATLAGAQAISKIGMISLNPAVTLGLGVFDAKKGATEYMLRLMLLELLGGAVGALFFVICRADEVFPVWFSGPNRPLGLFGSRILCEFLGTFVVTISACYAYAASAHQGAAAWAVGGAVMAMTYSLARVSGGHFNPAITLAVLASFRKKIYVFDTLVYMVTQGLAAWAAGACFIQVHEQSGSNILKLKPRGQFTWSTALVGELVFAAVVAFVFLCVTTTPAPARQSRETAYHGLAVGFAYTAAIAAIGGASGGLINPATTISIALTSASSLSDTMSYLGCQMGGALIAVGAFMVTYPDEYPVFKGQ